MDETALRLEVESPSPVARVVKGEIAWPTVSQKLDEAYQELSQSISLKGFRKGKVPRSMLAKMFQKRLASEISRGLVQEACVEAIKRLSLRPILPIHEWDLENDDLADGQPIHFTAKVEVLPDVEVKVYEGLEVQKREPHVTDESVEAFLHLQQEQLTQYLPVENRPIAVGDLVAGDAMGKVGDAAISEEKLTFQVVAPDVTPKQLSAGLERAALVVALSKVLVGTEAKTGERDLEVTFGDEAPEAWQGKTATLLFEVKAVREAKQPALDDAFARETGDADTLAEYRVLLRERLMDREEREIQKELRRQVGDALVEQNPFEVSGTVIEKQLHATLERTKLALQMRGINADDVGLSEEKLRTELRGESEKEVKRTLLLDAIANRENVQVSEAELDARLKELADGQGESVARLRADYEKHGSLESIRLILREEKVLDLLLSRAHVTKKVTPEADATGGTAAPETKPQ
jgi:trigger factor